MDTTLAELYFIGTILFAVGTTAVVMSIIPTKDGTTLFQDNTTEVMINCGIPAFSIGMLFLYLSVHWGMLDSFYPSMISHQPAESWGLT